MSVPRKKSDWAAKSAVVDALFSPWAEGRRPGGCVAVFHRGEAVHKKGYGLADLSSGTVIDSKTPFRLASLTKPIVAMAIMMLEERGALNYEDPIVRYFPEFSSYGKQITIAHLLTHTSGLEDYEDLFLKAGVIDAKYPTPAQLGPNGFEPGVDETVELLARQPLRFMPGDEWEYSNSGYVVLASLVERVSGIRLAQFLREHIFEPLGMHDSRLSEHASAEPELSDRAKGYIAEENAYTEADYSPLNGVYGPDGIYSTLNDMIKWCAGLHNETLVKSSTVNKAFTSSQLNNGAKTGYGFGWFVGENFDLPFVSHTGSWVGYRNFLLYYPSNQFGILVLSNSAEFNDAARSYVASRLGKLYLGSDSLTLKSGTVDHDVVRRYAGRYELPDGETFEVELRDGVLLVKSALCTTELLPESKVKFFVEGAESDTYFFSEDMEGRVNGVTRHLSLYGYSKEADSWARKLTP